MVADRVYDFAVIGGGLVGLAAARALVARHPGTALVLLEKENEVARHQSGRNSGVLHSGIYYKPGTLKAKLTAQGRQAMLDLCREQSIPYQICGKVILAKKEGEIPQLEQLYHQGLDNSLEVSLIDQDQLKEVEPYARASRALWVPQAGIVDFRQVAQCLAEDLQRQGAEVRLGTRLIDFANKKDALWMKTSRGDVRARFAVNCAGLFSDRLTRQSGIDPELLIVPFRGEYFRLRPGAQRLVRGLIYPLADPRFPFLGVHLTRTTDGEVLAGPNAVFSPKREGYQKFDFSIGDTFESLSYMGFWRLVLPHLNIGLGEMFRSWNVGAFARALQDMVPEIKVSDLEPAQAGVRAQAVDINGQLVEDFRFARGERWLHVLNAPSPAATASLAVGEHVADKVEELYV